MVGDSEDVLVAAAAHIHDDQMVGRQERRDFRDMRQRMRRLERGDDAFEPARQLERLQCLAVGDRNVLHAAEFVQRIRAQLETPAMLFVD